MPRSAIAIAPAMQAIVSAPVASVAAYRASHVCGAVGSPGTAIARTITNATHTASASCARLNPSLIKDSRRMRVGDGGPEEGAHEEPVASGEHESEHERQIGERERMAAASEVQMDDAGLCDHPAEGDRPPFELGPRERFRAPQRRGVQDGRQGGQGGSVQRDRADRRQAPAGLARRGLVTRVRHWPCSPTGASSRAWPLTSIVHSSRVSTKALTRWGKKLTLQYRCVAVGCADAAKRGTCGAGHGTHRPRRDTERRRRRASFGFLSLA